MNIKHQKHKKLFYIIIAVVALIIIYNLIRPVPKMKRFYRNNEEYS